MEPVSIIALIVGAIAAIASTAVNASSVNKTNQANKDLAAQQNQWNIEQWARQNAYNDPSEQVKRLAGAGLNPALAYGQGGLIDAGNSSGNLQAAGSTMQPFQMQDITHFGTDLANIDIQKQVADSQTKLNDANTLSTLADIPVKQKDAALKDMQSLSLKQDIDESKQRVIQSSATVDLLKSQKSLVNQQEISQRLSSFYDGLRTYSQLQSDEVGRELSRSEIAKNREETKKLIQECENLVSQKAFIEAQTDLVYNEVRNGNADFAVKYGYTKEEIGKSIINYHQTAIKELWADYNDADWRSSGTYKGARTAKTLIDIINPLSGLPAAAAKAK